jgi:exosome complex component MTR3
VPTASGSAYLELETPVESLQSTINAQPSSLKLSCTIHGPKPLPRNANFSPNLQLTVSVKFAPFATSQRRGYIRDATERDIATHLETALNGVIIPDRWPKSAIDIVITILEAEDDTQGVLPVQGIGNMNVVSGCITVASAALLDAQIDCLDLVTGGVAAVVVVSKDDGKAIKILDPAPFEESSINAVCVVGYMPARDEMTLIWAKGNIHSNEDEHMFGFDSLMDSAVNAAKGAHVVLRQVATELAQAKSTGITNDASKT